MATGKVTVTVNGKKVTRRTPRAYRFALVGWRDEATERASTLRRAEEHARTDFAFYASPEAEKYWRENGGYDDSAHDRRVRALGLEGYVAERLANAEAHLAAAKAKGIFAPHVLGWTQAESPWAAADRFTRDGYRGVTPVPEGGEYCCVYHGNGGKEEGCSDVHPRTLRDT